jgi:cation diffusion facilitator CzcD-associated flavoprotein CzcO
MADEFVDVLIVGAGLSGIGAGYHLQQRCPDRSYAILEARERIGGTWDLFRYPGIRSDSDMYTLGYAFRPWTDAKAIADGPSILAYVNATAREAGIDRRIRFRHKVVRADWSTPDACWTVQAERTRDDPAGGAPVVDTVSLRCNFLFVCSGYYRYDTGYTPEFPGRDRFAGRIVHPQHWPEDLDFAGKRVAVIGSGATAVTLVPAIAQTAAHVTMVQRSPTYVVSRPAEDAIANALRRVLPAKLAYWLVRWKNVLYGMMVFNLFRRRPDKAKDMLLMRLRQELGPGFDIGKHFTPRYNPWDQRLCLVPDSDLFIALREQRASVVTGDIETFTETGLRMRSGETVDADVIVTATGLELLFLGGMQLAVDGQPFEPSKAISYKGMMYDGVPNLAATFGYTNASWTLKADLTCEYVCRLLEHMRRTGTRQCMPVLRDPTVQPQPFVDFSSGYFQRALHRFPSQGSRRPWRLHQNYVKDILMLRFGALEDEAMVFGAPPSPASAAASTAAP